MSQLFLTSTVNYVTDDLPRHFEQPVKGQTLAFIDTATEIEEGDKKWVEEDKQALVKLGFTVFNYTLTDKNQAQIKKDLDQVDAIYVEGGNTFYLLQQAQQSGFIEVIRDYVINQGKPYLGTSAGSVIAGPDITPTKNLDNSSKAPTIKGYEGFNLVNYVILPHWGSDSFRESYLNQKLDFAYRKDQHPLLVLTDYQYAYVKDGVTQIIDVKRI